MPEGWRLVRLGKVADINRCAWKPTGDSRILYLDLTSVLAPGRLAPPKEILTEEAPTRARRKVCSGDILISTVRPYLQGFARVRKAQSNLVCSTGFAVLTPLTGVNESFLYHEVMTPWFLLYLQGAMTGQAYPAVRPDDVAGYGMPLPPLPEQRAIAEVLDSIDKALEDTEAVVAATERLRDALLHRLLTRGVPGWHSEWKDVRGLGTIPASWDVVRLEEVAEINHANWNPVDGSTILYLDLTSVVKPGILAQPKELAAKEAPSRARRRVKSGDILVSTVRPNLRGFVRVSKAPINLVASTGFAVVSPRREVNDSFVYHHVMTNQFARNLENATTGQAYPAVKASDVAAFRLALPPLAEQEDIASLLDSVDETIEHGRAETQMLQSLKASAADALLTGRVRVRQSR